MNVILTDTSIRTPGGHDSDQETGTAVTRKLPPPRVRSNRRRAYTSIARIIEALAGRRYPDAAKEAAFLCDLCTVIAISTAPSLTEETQREEDSL